MTSRDGPPIHDPLDVFVLRQPMLVCCHNSLAESMEYATILLVNSHKEGKYMKESKRILSFISLRYAEKIQLLQKYESSDEHQQAQPQQLSIRKPGRQAYAG